MGKRNSWPFGIHTINKCKSGIPWNCRYINDNPITTGIKESVVQSGRSVLQNIIQIWIPKTTCICIDCIPSNTCNYTK